MAASSNRTGSDAASALGLLLGASVLLVATAQSRTWSSHPAVAVGLAVGLLGVVAGIVAEPLLLPRVVGPGDPDRLRFDGLIGLYAAAAAVGSALVGNRPTSVVLLLVAGLLSGAATAGFVRVELHRAGAPASRALSVFAGLAIGVLIARFVPPLLPTLAHGAATRQWSYAAITAGTAGTYVLVVGAVAGVLVAVRLAAHAKHLRDLCLRAADPDQAAALPGAASVARRHPEALLETRQLDLSYGPLQVLFGVDFHVQPGEAVALLGTNGAGKSTLLRAITGLTAPSAGEVWFAGQRVTGVAAERMNRRGLLLVPGGRGVFPTLTVTDNLRVAGYHLGSAAYEAAVERITDAFPALGRRRTSQAGLLSGGEQQMLALGRAWLSSPALLAIDELTLGLAPGIVNDLLAFVRQLRDDGVSLVLVEQSVNTALAVCDRAYFLERGTVRFEGATTDLLRRGDLLRSVFLKGAAASTAAGVGLATVGSRS